MRKSLEEKQINEDDLRLTLGQRLFATLFWPIHLAIFIKGLFQNTDIDKND